MSGMVIEEGGRTHRLKTGPGDEAIDLASLLATRGFPLNTRCGGEGWCHGCQVELEAGALAGPSGCAGPAKLRACQVRLDAKASTPHIRIPDRSHLSLSPKVEDSFRLKINYVLSPPFEVQPGIKDTAFAVDIGTTTVVVLLADLSTGAGVSRAGDYNAQVRFGDNVLTRIGAAADPSTREAQRQAILKETLGPLLLRACERAGRPLSRLAGGSIAGNTTMLHLLLGEDPSGMGRAPFTPSFLSSRRLTVSELGLQLGDASGPLAPDLPVILLPGLSAFVGADLCGGMLATEMVSSQDDSLLVDFGTNGELILNANGRLYATACALGPAFEGAGLTSGTRAHRGALSRLRLTEKFTFELETIGGLPPAKAPGLCGTAYIDFLAEGRRRGLLLPNGRFDLDTYARLPASHQGGRGDFGWIIRIEEGVQITEADVAHLLNAKAAVAAGIETLLHHAGVFPGALSRLYVAGGFGMYLNIQNALDIGMLPGFAPDQVSVVGNTSLAGALLASLDESAVDEMEAYRMKTEIVELNLHPSFEDRFIDHLQLP